MTHTPETPAPPPDAPPEGERPKLYKVLLNGTSYNGGDFTYSLPRKRGRGYQLPTQLPLPFAA